MVRQPLQVFAYKSLLVLSYLWKASHFLANGTYMERSQTCIRYIDLEYRESKTKHFHFIMSLIHGKFQQKSVMFTFKYSVQMWNCSNCKCFEKRWRLTNLLNNGIKQKSIVLHPIWPHFRLKHIQHKYYIFINVLNPYQYWYKRVNQKWTPSQNWITADLIIKADKLYY